MKSGFAVNLQEFRKFFDSAKQMALMLLSWKHCVYEIVTKFYSFNNDVSLLIFSALFLSLIFHFNLNSISLDIFYNFDIIPSYKIRSTILS